MHNDSPPSYLLPLPVPTLSRPLPRLTRFFCIFSQVAHVPASAIAGLRTDPRYPRECLCGFHAHPPQVLCPVSARRAATVAIVLLLPASVRTGGLRARKGHQVPQVHHSLPRCTRLAPFIFFL